MLVTSSLNTNFLKHAWRNVAEKQGSENSKHIFTNLLSVIQSFSSLCLIVNVDFPFFLLNSFVTRE